MKVTCYIGVGSNLGNRRKNIRMALKKINALRNTRIIKKSKIIQTEPVGGPHPQPKFLNAVLKIETSISALKLLKELKRIEKELGRVKTIPCGPRTIDLDILFYGNKIMCSKNLYLPHPRLFERDFVLRPLAEAI